MNLAPIFLCPHSSTSGGVKVLFRIAQGLFDQKINAKMMVSRIDKNMCWLGKKPTVPIIVSKPFSKYDIPNETTHLITFGDGTSFGPLPDIPLILYLQHFGVHNYERECINLMYPYDAVVTVSKWLADIAAKQFNHEKVFIVPGGIDDNFKPVDCKRTGDFAVIGCLYHDAAFKNVDMFIFAMNKLYEKVPNLQILFMSAQEPKSDKLSNLACPYSFITNPPQHLIPAIYSAADVWVAPSRSEGFGLCPVEAMACAVPTVIVNSHGLDGYLVHNENCMMVNNSKTRMANMIDILLQDVEGRKRIIQGGQKLVKRFTWGRTVDSFIKVLETI